MLHSDFMSAGSARSCVRFRIYQFAHGDICEMHTLRSIRAFWRTDSSLIVIITHLFFSSVFSAERTRLLCPFPRYQLPQFVSVHPAASALRRIYI